MTVDPPLRDDLFGAADGELSGRYADYSTADLVHEGMLVYDDLSKPDVEDRVAENPQRVRADIARYWAQ